MVLNMADLVNSWKILQTLWNAIKSVLKWFPNASATVFFDLGGIRTGRKLADFEQKAWAVANCFEHGPFWQVLEMAPHSQKRVQKRSKMISDCFRDCFCRFRVNSQLSKIGRFWSMDLGYSPWFWTWPIFWTAGNSSKLSETPPKPF